MQYDTILRQNFDVCLDYSRDPKEEVNVRNLWKGFKIREDSPERIGLQRGINTMKRRNSASENSV